MAPELSSLPPWGCPEQGLSWREPCVGHGRGCAWGQAGWVCWVKWRKGCDCKARWENVRLGRVCVCVRVCV